MNILFQSTDEIDQTLSCFCNITFGENNRMKSKKKLIYKLHENINQNPYKVVEQISLRNAGVKTYDFNKLRSIRAISLRGQSTQNADQRNAYNATKILHYDEKDQAIYQRLIDAGVGNSKLGRKNGDYIVQQILTNRAHDNRGPFLPQMGHKGSHIKQRDTTQDPHYPKDPQLSNRKSQIRPKNSIKHHRNVSLPVINLMHESEVGSKTVDVTPRRKEFVPFAEEQKAKELAMKEIGAKGSLSKIISSSQNTLKSQQKINTQVLESIKLKSLQTLERIARSRSEAVMVDKWKQKYGQSPKTNSIKTIEMINQKSFQRLSTTIAERCLLPRLHQQGKSSTLNDEEMGLVTQVQDTQEVKGDRYESYGNSQEVYREKEESNCESLHSHSVQMPLNHSSVQKKHIFSFNYYLLRQNPTSIGQKLKEPTQLKEEFLSSQPLNITVTKMKKHQRKNKQNLNLQTIHQKDKINSNLNQIPQKKSDKQIDSECAERISDKIKENSTKSVQSIRQQKISSENMEVGNSDDKVKKFLSFKEQKGGHEKKQPLPSIDSQSSNRQRIQPKYQLNKQKFFMQKLRESEIMMEWQNKKSTDIEQLQFHAFVKRRVNEVSQ